MANRRIHQQSWPAPLSMPIQDEDGDYTDLDLTVEVRGDWDEPDPSVGAFNWVFNPDPNEDASIIVHVEQEEYKQLEGTELAMMYPTAEDFKIAVDQLADHIQENYEEE